MPVHQMGVAVTAGRWILDLVSSPFWINGQMPIRLSKENVEDLHRQITITFLSTTDSWCNYTYREP
jgi:hypothetical protein